LFVNWTQVNLTTLFYAGKPLTDRTLHWSGPSQMARM
jgi:hypothetical protein